MVSIFEERLKGGHHYSLGNTLEVVDEVLKDKSLLGELYKCYFSDDELVRLRTSNAWKRVTLNDVNNFLPFKYRFISEISMIDQASTKWTLALLFKYSQEYLSEVQLKKVKEILKKNLSEEKDWIVLKNTIDLLGDWSANDDSLKKWLIPHLERLSSFTGKVVPNAAKKWLEKLK